MVNSVNLRSRRPVRPAIPLIEKPSPITIGLGDSHDGGSKRAHDVLPSSQNLKIPALSINPEFRDLDNFAVKVIRSDPSHAKHSSDSFDQELTKTVRWDIEKARQVVWAISRNKDFEVIQKIYPEAYIPAKLMLERLTFQSQVFRVRSASPKEMVRLSFLHGPDFAGLWKSAREAARFAWLGVNTWVQPPENPFAKLIDYSIGENGVYHQRFFIFWEEKCDDYTYSLEEAVGLDQEVLSDLKETAKTLSDRWLRKEDFGDEIDLLLECLPVSSSCFLENYGSKRKEWESEFYSLYSLKEEPNLRGKQAVAPKRPGETRDITIPSPGVLRRCKRLNRPLRQSIKRLRSCPMGKDKEACIEVMEDHDTVPFHYLRDFRKIGLTLPKPVIRAFLEGFFHKYPEFRDMAVEFFCNTSLLIEHDGIPVWVPTKSGFHMGFFNEGLTWIQYAVHSLVMDHIPKCQTAVKFTAFNDDSLISCRKFKTLNLYETIDQELWSKLRCPLSNNKCGLSKNSFVYLEEIYKDGKRYPKDSYFALSTLGGKYALNIVHAKDYVNAITMSLEEMTVAFLLALEEVITHWGTEFYPGEHSQPYIFGGWMTPKENGLDASLRSYNGSKHHKCAYNAVMNGSTQGISVKQGSGWTHLAKLSEMSLFGEIPQGLDKVCGASLHFLEEASAKRSYSRLALDQRALTRFYYRAFARRKVIYKDKPPDPLDEWFLKHPNSVITHHTVGEAVDDGMMMTRDALSIMHGKPQRLGFQTLINEGVIRTSLTNKIKWPEPLQTCLLKGYVYHLPRLKLPEKRYVHECLLHGSYRAYEEYCNQNGRFPTSRKATIQSEVFLESADSGVPWQIVHMLKEIGQMDDLSLYQNIMANLNSEEVLNSPPTSPVQEEEGQTSHQEPQPSGMSASLVLQLLKAGNPNWDGSFPTDSAVEENYSLLKREYLFSHTLLEVVTSRVMPSPSRDDDPVIHDGSSTPEGVLEPGIWDVDDDWGTSIGDLFGDE